VRLGFGVGRGPFGVTVVARRLEVRDAVQAPDRIGLGGTDGAILSSTSLAGRVAVPALPVGTRVGDEYRGGRVAIRLGRRMPVELFAGSHRVTGGAAAEDGAIELAGIEWIVRTGAQPIVRLPSTRVRIGVAHVLRDPADRLEGRTHGWVAVSWWP
jgi:hypothetical protein